MIANMMLGLRKTLSRRDVLISATILSASGIGLARKPWKSVVVLSDGKLKQIFPEKFGNWVDTGSEGLVLPPEQQAKSDRTYADILARNYITADGNLVMLLIAYDQKQSGMLQVHRPEACYPASGFKISQIKEASVNLGDRMVPALSLTATNGPRIEQVLYWTRIGRAFPLSYDDQRASLVRQNLLGLEPDGALIRLSVLNPDAAASLKLMSDFARLLYRSSPIRGQDMLAGPDR